jgi:hypothetical protein
LLVPLSEKERDRKERSCTLAFWVNNKRKETIQKCCHLVFLGGEQVEGFREDEIEKKLEKDKFSSSHFCFLSGEQDEGNIPKILQSCFLDKEQI